MVEPTAAPSHTRRFMNTLLLVGRLNQVSPEMIRDGVVFMVALILSISVHEFGHAQVADLLGDRLPRSQGRVTLNPLSHIDLWGTIVFPLIMVVSWAMGAPLALLGWGKPVQISSRVPRYRFGLGHRAGQFLIAAAGPTMNILFGLVLSVVFVVAVRAGGGPEVAKVLASFVLMNIALACFNLLPCPPLDGGALLSMAMGPDHPIPRFLEKYGSMIFIGLLITGALSYVMLPATHLAHFWIAHLIQWAI